MMNGISLQLLPSVRVLLAAIMMCALLPQAAFAQPKSQGAKVKVTVLKPLVLTKVQDLDFGVIAAPALAGDVTVSISQAGVLGCPAPLICSGLAQPATYNVKGSNRAAVTINVNVGDLTNAADGTTLAFTATAPSIINLPNSGNKGTDFAIGGSIVLTDGASGAYEGTIEVIAEYQ
ncbi:DUF4402 domain-containing protein [Sphingomicrobium flavum]|uniref:DUF4402 domain-containing protein n=1 Tax=Sphingomicrobium flavum TaxID=1229164 RepID=UPI0021AD6A05|nr:DUF4402 domain-containing protein [Sphingomicrobium flavum]